MDAELKGLGTADCSVLARGVEIKVVKHITCQQTELRWNNYMFHH
jgi:hypothetical protein